VHGEAGPRKDYGRGCEKPEKKYSHAADRSRKPLYGSVNYVEIVEIFARLNVANIILWARLLNLKKIPIAAKLANNVWFSIRDKK